MAERIWETTRFKGWTDYQKQLSSGNLMNLPQCEICSGECFDGESLEDSELICIFCTKQKNGQFTCTLNTF